MIPIYQIFTYNLIGTVLYAFETLKFQQVTNIKKHGNKVERVYGIMGGEPFSIESNRIYTLSETPKGVDRSTVTHLPYNATVTEDLPGSCRLLKPKVYKGCQLMTETHGSYLQFQHMKSGKVLRIAINSHYYEPTN